MRTDSDQIAQAFRAAFGTVVEPAVEAPTWEALGEQVAAGPPDVAGSLRSFLRRPLVVVAGAAVAALVAIGGALLVLGSGGDPAAPAATTVTAPAESTVFSWNGGELSEWVTEDEMTDALAYLSTEYLGADLDGTVRVDKEEDWVWSFQLVGDTGVWQVIAHNGDHRPEGGVAEPNQSDPRLPPGVKYEAFGGFAHGFYGLSGPNSDESICMTLMSPDSYWGYPEGAEVRTHEDRIFALASMMLREMGWAD